MNLGIILFIAVAVLWTLSVFLGAISGFSKHLTHNPSAMDSTAIKSEAHQSIAETEARRKQMMDDMRQKMQDSTHRY